MSENFYIVENTGETRTAWGPYPSLTAAKHAAGKRHVVVQGRLRNGQTMTRGELHNRLAAGSVYPVDGSRADCIA